MKRYLSAVYLVFGVVWLVACGEENTISEPIVIEEESFIASPTSGAAPLETTFSWQIRSGESLTCTLEFGDGTENAVIENCTSSSTQAHTYQEEGSYTAELTVSDRNSEPVSSTTTITVGRDDSPPNGGERPECTLESNNNSQDTACRLNIDKTYKGQLGTEEESDYYVFTTPQGSAGVAEVLLASIPAGQRLTFELLDVNKTPIDSPVTSYTDGNPGEFFVLSPANTTYYLRVSNGRSGNTSNETYNISVAYRPDDDELNEGVGQATALTFSDGVTSEEDGLAYGFTYTDGKKEDIDVYEMNVTLAEGQAGVISVVLPNAPVGLRSSVLNEAEQPIKDGFSNDTFTGENEELEYDIITESRTLYLKLERASSDKGNTEPYRLNTSLDTKDIFEPNNSDARAAEVSLGESVEGYINGQFIENGEFSEDVDYYVITPQPTQDIEVELFSVPENQTLNIQVLNLNGSPISGASGFATSTTPRTLTVPSSENPAFVKIAYRSGEFSPDDSYTLRINGLQ